MRAKVSENFFEFLSTWLDQQVFNEPLKLENLVTKRIRLISMLQILFTLTEESLALQVPKLTTMERNKWARARKTHLMTGVNAESRDLIERAICCVNLLLDQAPEDLSERAQMAMHFNARSALWYDKCLNVIVYGNGRCAVNCEHSMADAPAYAHMWEFALTRDVRA